MEDKRKRRKFRKILLIAVLLAAAAVYGTASRSSEQDISVSLGEDSQEEVSTERKEGETAERGLDLKSPGIRTPAARSY